MLDQSGGVSLYASHSGDGLWSDQEIAVDGPIWPDSGDI